MDSSQLKAVRTFESEIRELDQIELTTWHTLHGGIYSRTVVLKKGVTIVGAEIVVPTTLFISGSLLINTGGDTIDFSGVHIIPASVGRKQTMYAVDDTTLTMSFATNATSIEEAENEFTCEPNNLMSRLEESINHVIITGE